MSRRARDPIRSLYVHVPFCARKCEYCAFYSEAANGEIISRYVGALIRELEMVAPDLGVYFEDPVAVVGGSLHGVPPLGGPHAAPPKGGTPNRISKHAPRLRTIFFGGGTPSLLNLRQWGDILQAMERLGLTGAEEWTVECNPATVSLDKAKLLRDHGVNRISMGVQSLDAALLDRLGRVHSREMVFKSFDILRAAGFANLNIDLMFAIPGQTLEMWRRTLSEATALGSEHLSTYEVIYEEDTPLFAQLQAGAFDVDEDLACDMYEELIEHAGRAGFRQYEVANFARGTAGSLADDPEIPALACRHNVNYWRGGSFYGLGPSATGYVRGVRAKNWSNTQLYCEQIEKGRRAIESREELTPLARAGETAAFGLRMNAGWPFEQFEHVTGWDLRREWSGDLQQLVRQGWGRLESERFRLTREGLRFADSAAQLFLR